MQFKVNVSVPAAVGVCVAVPMLVCEPLHAPLAVQAVPMGADQLRVVDCPSVTDVGLTLIVIIAGVIIMTAGAW